MKPVPRRPNAAFPPTAAATCRSLARLALFACVAGSARVPAQTLALRHYDVGDGLSSSRVISFHQDAKGYLWMGTWEGLCRFDGHEIVAYDHADGIENPVINMIVEDRGGDIWAGTNGGGIARFLDSSAWTSSARPAASFATYRVSDLRKSNVVDALLFDRDGNLWCGTEAGLYRARAPLGSPPVFEAVTNRRPAWPQALMQDRQGRVWMGTGEDLWEVSTGRIAPSPVPRDPPLGDCVAVVEDMDGTLLCAFDHGLLRFDPGYRDARDDPESGSTRDDPESRTARVDPASRTAPGGAWSKLALDLEADQKIRAILPVDRGRAWIATTKGLVKWSPTGQVTFTTRNGLTDDWLRALLLDRDHNLWIGTWSGGACKLVSESITNFTMADGLPARNAIRLVATQSGSIIATTGRGMVEITGDRLTLVPGSREPPFDKAAEHILQDRRGDFWVGTEQGLFRCAGPKLQFQKVEHLGPEDGIPREPIHGIIHEARDGTIWTSTADARIHALDPEASPPPRFRPALQGEPLADGPVREWFSAKSGALWLAPSTALLRLANGRLSKVEPLGELAANEVRCFHESAKGELWIGTRYHGASVTADPDAEHPTFRGWKTRDGLESDAVWSITEDRRGRIYLGTARGLERLDPESGRVEHITTFEGLAGDIVYHCLRDAQGSIWAATSNGVSRIDPRADEPEPAPPPVYIARVQIAGRDLALPLSGAQDVGEQMLSAADDNLRVDYRAVSLRSERELRYQYRLEGVDHEWSEPTTQRSVIYGRIAPGSYRFLVRALHGQGKTSPRPATFAFTIPPPLWRTWWFVTLAIAAAASIVIALHRLRVRRIVALESIRRQIATDIHDDMGAGLAQIAILSEVAKREAGAGAHTHLEEVARLARNLRDSMSDIVWAVDPRRDRASDLVQRMRQVAFNLFEAEGVKVELEAPPEAAIESIGLAPDRRRHLLLIFKEAVSNIARHARASEVHIDVRLALSELVLSIRDDGVGFDPSSPTTGHGLESLRLRAAALRARLSIVSAPGEGTSIELSMPL